MRVARRLLATGCEREHRRYEVSASVASDAGRLQTSKLHAGPAASARVGSQADLFLGFAQGRCDGIGVCGRKRTSLAVSAHAAVMRPAAKNPYEENAHTVSQGKPFLRWYNCNGCHANGRGGMGPPLMDAQWLYGHEPEQIVATILQGRPNGMPSFAGRIPDDQDWQIAADVRSMSGQLRTDVAPRRSDSLSSGPSQTRRDKASPTTAASAP